jgi:hypothetical protein
LHASCISESSIGRTASSGVDIVDLVLTREEIRASHISSR